MLEFDINELKKICRDLNVLSDLKIDLWDEKKELLFSYPHKHRRFCETVRECPALCLRCRESDAVGFERADSTGGIYSYKCHMGLTETIVPIKGDGAVMGYLMLGQAIEHENVKEIEERIKEAAAYGADAEKMSAIIQNESKTDRDKISAAANVLGMITDYLRQKNIVGKKREKLFTMAEDYIRMHLSEELSVESLCRYLNISKTSLYHLSVENCGTGIGAFIRNIRMETAKKLLGSGEYDIRRTAEKVGIPDADYFAKIFKKETGLTPTAYRKRTKMRE